MPVKPHAEPCRIREQIIEDLPSGLMLQFEVIDSGYRVRVAGRALHGGNREFFFDRAGNFVRAGSCGELRRPSWLSRVV